MITKELVVIWGASGHAMVVADILRLSGQYEIVGFLDDIHIDRHGTPFCGAIVLGGQEELDRLLEKGIKNIILAFGDCKARLRLSRLAKQKGFNLVTATHPRAIVANDAAVGPGSVIAAAAVISPAVIVGENVIINTAATVDHESIVADGAHICPGVHLGGCVSVGRAGWVGIGTTVNDHVSIGAGSFIGAGSVVVDDIPENVIAYGVPAKIVRT